MTAMLEMRGVSKSFAGVRAQGLLKARRSILDRGARTLLEKETLEQSDLAALVKDTPK